MFLQIVATGRQARAEVQLTTMAQGVASEAMPRLEIFTAMAVVVGADAERVALAHLGSLKGMIAQAVRQFRTLAMKRLVFLISRRLALRSLTTGTHPKSPSLMRLRRRLKSH
tara:strand:+ start:242 stop:577 length:336 start_codon:yes stop_codon:yes gene_type:complete